MGLTIHYTLQAPPDTEAAPARAFVMRLRQRALEFKRRQRVEAVHPLGDDADALRWAEEWLFFPVPGHPNLQHQICITPEAGFLFPIEVGEDCEPLWLGLCRYPQSVRVEGKLRRTKLDGWRFARFCKTQYASLHGWPHFHRCHAAVTDLLAGARRLGLDVCINDEGDFWPGRDLEALQRNLNLMNGVVAATAGVLKDVDEAVHGRSAVESPIFRHAQFERLEAEGEAQAGELARRACRQIAGLVVNRGK